MRRSLNFIERIVLLTIFFLILAGIAITVTHFTLGTKLQSLETENNSLQEQYATLVIYLENKEFYKESTVENTLELLDLADTFPADITKKSTLVKYDELLEKYELDSATLSLNECTDIIELPCSYDGVDYNLVCKSVPVDVSYSLSYSNLKQFVKDIRELGDKVYINSISISKDATTGKISGMLNTTEYAVSGGRKSYKDPEVNINVGVDFMFDDTAESSDSTSNQINSEIDVEDDVDSIDSEEVIVDTLNTQTEGSDTDEEATEE